jgi:hypothetical protein
MECPPKKQKISAILGIKSGVLLTFICKFWAKKGRGAKSATEITQNMMNKTLNKH